MYQLNVEQLNRNRNIQQIHFYFYEISNLYTAQLPGSVF